MRTYLTSDWHADIKSYNSLNVKSPFDDLKGHIRGLIGTAMSDTEPHRELIHLGDVTDTSKPSPYYVDELCELFKELRKYFERIIVLEGNHTAGAMRFLRHVGVDVVCDVTVDTRMKRVYVPHVDRDVAVLAEDIRKTISGGGWTIFGHYETTVGMRGSEAMMIARKPLALPEFVEAKRVVLGHIHKPQVIGNVIYVGSAIRCDFAERDEVKGYGIIDSASDAYVHCGVDTQELVQFKVGKRGLTEEQLEQARGRVVKVIYTADIDRTAVRDAINKVGFLRIEDTDIAEKELVKEVSLEASEDIFTVSLDEWIAQQDISKPMQRAVHGKVVQYLDEGKVELGANKDILIQSLTLIDYGSYRNVTVQLGAGLIGIVGRYDGADDKSNGSGKSLIVDAVLLALYGYTRATQDETVRDGQEGYEVGMTFTVGEHKCSIGRKYTKVSGSEAVLIVDGEKVAKGGAVTSYVAENLLRISLEAFTNTCFFTQDNQEEFLRSTDAARLDCLKSYLNLDCIDKALKRVKDEVRGASVEVDTHKGVLASVANDIADMPKMTVAAAKKKLEGLDEASSEYAADKAKLTKEVSKLTKLDEQYRQYKAVQREFDDVDAQYAKAKEDLEVLKEVDTEGLREAVKAAQAVVDKANEKKAKLKATLDGIEVEGKKAKALVTSPKCPLDLKCPFLEDAAFKSKAKAQHAALQGQYKEVEGEYSAAVKACETAARKVSEAEQEALSAANIGKAKAKVEGTLEQLTERRTALRAKLKSLQAEAVDKELKAAVARVEDIGEKLDAVTEERAELEAYIKVIDGLAEKRKDAQAKLDMAEVKLEVAELAAKALSRDGFVISYLQSAMSYIEDATNKMLIRLGADELMVSMNVKQARGTAGLAITMQGRSFVTYSGAQKSLVTFSVRLAVYKLLMLRGLAGGVLILDEVLGKLDAHNKGVIMRVVSELGTSFKQVLFITHTELKDALPRVVEVVRGADGISRIGIER